MLHTCIWFDRRTLLRLKKSQWYQHQPVLLRDYLSIQWRTSQTPPHVTLPPNHLALLVLKTQTTHPCSRDLLVKPGNWRLVRSWWNVWSALLQLSCMLRPGRLSVPERAVNMTSVPSVSSSITEPETVLLNPTRKPELVNSQSTLKRVRRIWDVFCKIGIISAGTHYGIYFCTYQSHVSWKVIKVSIKFCSPDSYLLQHSWPITWPYPFVPRTSILF